MKEKINFKNEDRENLEIYTINACYDNNENNLFNIFENPNNYNSEIFKEEEKKIEFGDYDMLKQNCNFEVNKNQLKFTDF